MRSCSVRLLCVVVFIAIYCSETNEHQISLDAAKTNLDQQQNPLLRAKRELENFDDDYPTSPNKELQDEPSFWDKIVSAALKLFSRFVEWLNSS